MIGISPENSRISCRFTRAWRFDWLDVAAVDPRRRSGSWNIRWSTRIRSTPDLRRITLRQATPRTRCSVGVPNGAAQAAIDARTLADALRNPRRPRATTLQAYEAVPPQPAAKSRAHQPRICRPDFINIKVEELVATGRSRISTATSARDELRAVSGKLQAYRRFALSDVSRPERLKDVYQQSIQRVSLFLGELPPVSSTRTLARSRVNRIAMTTMDRLSGCRHLHLDG